eukprot:m.22340 g.22340  ORF g.22340 m.22340 type:complete len:52 (-) comp9287_c0_seq2:162-317(-)
MALVALNFIQLSVYIAFWFETYNQTTTELLTWKLNKKKPFSCRRAAAFSRP